MGHGEPLKNHVWTRHDVLVQEVLQDHFQQQLFFAQELQSPDTSGTDERLQNWRR